MSKKKPIIINKLKPNTTLYIETNTFMYEVILLSRDGQCTIRGGTMFAEATKAKITGSVSTAKSKTKHPHKIYHNMCIELYISDKKHIFLIDPVMSIILKGENWEYDVWGDK